MASILKALSESNSTGPRHIRTVDTPEKQDTSFPMVTSVEEYKRIFMEEVTSDHAPVRLLTESEVAKYVGRGWEIPDNGWAGWDPSQDPGHCARFYIETRDRVPVEGVIGKIAAIQHRNNVHMGLSASHPGTFHHQLMMNRHTSSGRWRPALIEFDTDMAPFLDRVVPSRRSLPGEGAKNYELLDGAGAGMVNGWTEMANTNREVLITRILWVDITRTREPRISEDGKILPDTNITLKNNTDGMSELAAAIRAMSGKSEDVAESASDEAPRNRGGRPPNASRMPDPTKKD